MLPPVWKSGKSLKLLPFKYLTLPSISSLKLWGSILVESPTAIPSAPWANNNGNFTGKWIGSFFLPSYESCQLVVFGLKTTSSANFDNLASI